MLTPTLPFEIEGAAAEAPNGLAPPASDSELFSDPPDYSAIGGPENEPAYGRTRALAGEYPFNAYGGPYDRDERSDVERGGIMTHHRLEKRS